MQTAISPARKAAGLDPIRTSRREKRRRLSRYFDTLEEMLKQDIIAVGASAGGIDALRILVGGLPADLNASIFVVLHIGFGINGQSYLPEILSKAGPLRAVNPKHGEQIERGKIYLAPPDCHLLVTPDRILLSHGPKENRSRPAINPLFRSAAQSYGGRVTGVILTGMLDDGTAGLAEIKRQGGVAVVQDPSSALYSSMPFSAIQHVDVDYVAPLPEIAGIVCHLASTERDTLKQEEPMDKKATQLTCPECRGPLSEERQGRIVEFSCRVGHRYTPLAMESEHHETVERSLWASVVALEEAADIGELLASDLGSKAMDEAQRKRRKAAVLKEMLNESPSE
jgi:two-component system chemotaxis response regulator CheB